MRLRVWCLVLCGMFGITSLFSQTKDSTQVDREQKQILWNPFNTESLALKARLFYPDNLSVSMDAPSKNVFIPQYYDLKNVLPDNPLMLDYRTGSYYTPKNVSDQLARIMQRPRPDSFLPWPGLALLGAYAAIQYLMHKDQFEIKARAYLLDAADETVLLALWKKAPQTAADLLLLPDIAAQDSYLTLQERLNRLEDKMLIKSKTIEKEPTQYFPAQKRADVILLLSNGLEDDRLTREERQKIVNLLKKIKEL